MYKALLFISSLALFSCTNKKLGPDESLREFVGKSIRGEMTRDTLLETTTGNLKAELENLDDEEMTKYLKLEGANHESFRINLKNCEGDTCYLTYTLRYAQSKDGQKTFDVELKKMAELRKVEEEWLLADVTDIKTYYEAQQPIEP